MAQALPGRHGSCIGAILWLYPGTPVTSAPPPGSDLDRSIWRFILRYSLREQLGVLAITLIALPFYYYSLDLPKTIVNEINGRVAYPEYLGQVGYLMALCAEFLALVVVNGVLKYWINVLKGRLGERMLRRLRFELYRRILHFPLGHFRRISPGELIPMITSEVEPIGGFIGDAFVLPVQQGGTLLTAVFFLFMQDWVLGFAAIALYPLQAWLVPRLQRRVNILASRRVKTVRVMAERVGETVSGIVEIRADAGTDWRLADFSHRMASIYRIRLEIFQRKFLVKFVNNLINQLTPFFFFSVGGYLVIRGQLSFGALVAVLAAYKDLASPWKELLDFYQIKEDARIKYEQVVEQFDPPGLLRPASDEAGAEALPAGPLTLAGVTLVEEDRGRILDGIDLRLDFTEHTALLGPAGAGGSELAAIMAGLSPPTSGRITLGERDLASIPVAVLGRHVGYVGPAPVIFTGSLRDNLVLGLRQRPMVGGRALGMADLAEARRTGNSDLDPEAPWIDLERIGLGEAGGLDPVLLDALRLVGLEDDVYAFGLFMRLDPDAHPVEAGRILAAREALAVRLEAGDLAGLVERFDPARYNDNLSLGENLLFGTPLDPGFEPPRLAANERVLGVLRQLGLVDDLTRIGLAIAATMVEIFADLPAGHPFFEQYGFIAADALPTYRAILGRAEGGALEALRGDDRRLLLTLPFRLIEPRHRLGLIDAALKTRILEARRAFALSLPESEHGRVGFFDPAHFNPAMSILDNILFGLVVHGAADGPGRVLTLVGETLDSLGLRETVMRAALDWQVGSGGSRLSLGQRQKLAIARAIVKRPDLLILNGTLAGLDPAAEAKLMTALAQEFAGRGLIAMLHRASLARRFDRVVVLERGRVIEDCPGTDFARPDSRVGRLVAAEGS
jgi:ABC-type multidrug transport system fused ATPase/permease subunit